MQTNNCVIGIDIGGTNTSFGFVDRKGGLIYETTLSTQADQPAHVLVSRLCDSIEKLKGSNGCQTYTLDKGPFN
jgi:predicted NBD/HSP70 family sugar kinase